MHTRHVLGIYIYVPVRTQYVHLHTKYVLCIWSIKKFFILWTGIIPVNVQICRWLLGIWHLHVCIMLRHSSKSCKEGLSKKKKGMNRYIHACI